LKLHQINYEITPILVTLEAQLPTRLLLRDSSANAGIAMTPNALLTSQIAQLLMQ